MMARAASVLFLLLLLLPGCGIRRLMVGEMAKVMEDGFPAYLKEPDPVLVRDAMAANLKLIEALLESDPENERLLQLACQGFASHAFLFVETEDPSRAKALYARARQYGYTLLEERGLIPDAVYDPAAWDKALAGARQEDVPAIFWTAFAWGGEIQLDRESPVALADLPMVIRLVEQAAALDPGYWFAGPDTFLGFYNGSVPVPLGGRADKAEAHFEKALSLTERRSLMVQVLYARSYCIQVQDRERFDRLLDEVIAADPHQLPAETALSNAVARRRAGELKQAAGEYFTGE